MCMFKIALLSNAILVLDHPFACYDVRQKGHAYRQAGPVSPRQSGMSQCDCNNVQLQLGCSPVRAVALYG